MSIYSNWQRDTVESRDSLGSSPRIDTREVSSIYIEPLAYG